MNRSGIALVLLVLLLPPALLGNHQAASSPLTAVAEGDWVAFSYEGGAQWSGPASIDQQLVTAPYAETDQQDTLCDDDALVTLQGDVVHVHRESDLLWHSDPSWDVRHMVVADANNDGQQEVALVLWKPFHREPGIFYDTFRFPSPWEEGSLRNQLFLYGWRDNQWKALWCSSPIADPIIELAVGDVDGDGANELVVLEGSYADRLDQAAGHVSAWRWNGWGFALLWRCPGGTYEHLALQDVTGDGILEILVQNRR
jgi:hypothetical protein